MPETFAENGAVFAALKTKPYAFAIAEKSGAYLCAMRTDKQDKALGEKAKLKTVMKKLGAAESKIAYGLVKKSGTDVEITIKEGPVPPSSDLTTKVKPALGASKAPTIIDETSTTPPTPPTTGDLDEEKKVDDEDGRDTTKVQGLLTKATNAWKTKAVAQKNKNAEKLKELMAVAKSLESVNPADAAAVTAMIKRVIAPMKKKYDTAFDNTKSALESLASNLEDNDAKDTLVRAQVAVVEIYTDPGISSVASAFEEVNFFSDLKEAAVILAKFVEAYNELYR